MIDRIQLVLQTKNLTPGRFADEIGVQRSSVSHVLSGRNGPGLEFIQKILRRFPDISAAWLVSGEGEMYPGLMAGQTPSRGKAAIRSAIPDLFSGAQLYQEPEAVKAEPTRTESESRIEEVKPESDTVEITVIKDRAVESTVRKNMASSIGQMPLPQQPRDVTEEAKAQSRHISDENIESPASVSKEEKAITPLSGRKLIRVLLLYSDGSFESFEHGT